MGDTDGWMPIASMPNDGSQILFRFRNGTVSAGPALPPAELTVTQKRQIYEADGSWPNAGFTPEFWKPIDASGPPQE